MLPRRRPSGGGTCDRYLLPCVIGVVTVIFLSGELVNAQRYNENPPRYSYDNLPKTGFACKGKLPGRYYPDPETDCQMFHVCVKMNHREVQDFKFLCPNGTVFDAEHQVCIDYYQVVCHSDGTNPLGQIFEIFKLSSGQTRDLDVGKLSFVSPPDSVERNTLGDDFQVEEYNNNRLASSQNALNFRASPPAPTPSKATKSHKSKEDIFFSNKGFVPSNNFGSYQQQSSTTRRPTTSRTTTTTTTTTTTEAPSSSTPRRPSLETFESYETESFSGFIPSRNSFGRGFEQPSSPPDFDASTEDFTPKDEIEQYQTTKPSTTQRPYIFQNTFRTTLSHVPSTARPVVQQTFQQQASRFNEDYFTRIPSTTRRPSKTAQFFLHSTIADDYFTPEFRQSTETPFVSNRRKQQPRTTSTTIRPSVIFQSNSGTVRPVFRGTATTVDYQYETSTVPSTTTTTDAPPSTTEYFRRYSQQNEEFEARQTTTYNNEFSRSTNFFSAFDNKKQKQDEKLGKSTSQPRDFPPQLSPEFVEEESLRPRNIHGSSNPKNALSDNPISQPPPVPRDNFGFSTIPPPTTAEPFSTPLPTTASATEPETAQTLATRLQNQLFKKTTTVKSPEKYSIFFGRSTQSVDDDRLPNPGPTTVLYYDSNSSTPRPRHRVRSTTVSPDFEQPSKGVTFDRRRLSRFGLVSSTVAPESNSTRPQRRGGRRRVKIPAGQRQNGTDFDPQLKYKRRRFEAARVNAEGKEAAAQKNDEIFNAEASVFRGDPSLNFFQEQQKNEKSEPRKIEQSQKQPEQNEKRQPVNHYERNYGRRVRPNGGDEQQTVHDNERRNNNNRGNVPANRVNNGEDSRTPPLPPGNGPQLRRRVVKRIRPKTSTPEPGAIEDGSQKKQFIVTGSTLRPVTRINVKTKLGGKISTTYRTTEITDGSPSSTPSSTTSTTTEPELVTAPDDVVAQIREKNSSPAPTLKKQFLHNASKQNDSHLIIKLVSDKPAFPTSSSFLSSPFSIKKPIITSQSKPSLSPVIKPKGQKKVEENEEESNTRSPDYDYAYYNTDDGSDYDAETTKLDHKNYGKKPKTGHSN